ncbi:sulfate transporter family protein-like protein [Amylocarpus encephaloides]|uniref:Sulfate transporter family protein-like protein n=1 Tax=Amylocarpus encephaloides TaxID=45428 RepID=A0A9P7YTM5_9HELO|nr:sulfate transporter family protein-like protein [Amylocarpus encephaloides]
MSLPQGFASFRRVRANSNPQSCPQVIPGTSNSQPHETQSTRSNGPARDINYGLIRGHVDAQAHNANNPSSSHREPTRSSLHMLSYHGPSAPVDSAHYSLSVREETAELASYALSDKASIQSSSPPRRTSVQTHLESFFAGGSDNESSTTFGEGLHHDTIREVSEPGSPENGHSPPSGHSGTSALSNMIRRSPPSTSPPNEAVGTRDRPWSNGYGHRVEPDQTRLIITSDGKVENERTPLLAKTRSREPHTHPDWIRGEQDLEQQDLRRRRSWPKIRDAIAQHKARGLGIARTVFSPKSWDKKAIWQHGIVAPVGYLPAVILGALLNVLDALSYGMILFPLGQPIFEKLGSAGISMFYVSCIISQLVYSCGGSRFKGGIGSEMIEVVPFFHKMAFTIIAKVGEENPKAVIATTITSYAISSILTGLIFFLIGTCRFGYIVGFIPRHILIGCIGGVGWFLIATGFEVTARLDGNLEYNLPTLKKMFDGDTVALWLIPFVLAVALFQLQKKIKNRYFLPIYILAIPVIFYFFVFSLDELQLDNLTQTGWVFAGPKAGEPWWYFYTLYDFNLVHWGAIADTIPAMFALTFFGILHVPINVPSLAFSVGEDNLSLDRELIAHGLSNALSGFAGSIQNYLVYANSVLFYKSGGDSRLAGIMLAVLTVGIMVIGPSLISYIPVMMVGTLIFLLGFELLIEAVWTPRRKLKILEYITVVTIVLIMGIYDFVVGIFIGIGLAFVSLTVQQSRVPAIRASYSGEIAGSTVRRNPTQSGYLRKTGQQVHITKLAGYLFFGTIVSVEERLRALIEDESFGERPIRFLVLDLWHVTGIDYSAAEAFNRVNRVFSKKGVTLVISGVDADGPLGSTLLAVGIGQDANEVKLFEDLNSALEDCENELLRTLYASKEARSTRNSPAFLEVPDPGQQTLQVHHSIDAQFSSPRRNQLQRAANSTLDDSPNETRYANFKEPLRLILQTFQGLTDKNEDFWFRITPFLTKKAYLAGTVLYQCGESATGFYLLEDGILRADYDLPQGRYFESIVAGTTCGELPFFSETDRTATVQAERDCTTWLMDRDNWERLQKAEPDVAQELLRISLKLTSERMSAITSYVLITAG